MSLGNRCVPVLRLARRLVVGVVLAYVVVVVLLGGTAAARPVFHGLALAWIFVLAIHACWPHRVVPGGWVSKTRPTLQRLELISTNIGLIFLLAEASLRTYAACSGNTLVVDAGVDGYHLSPGQDYGAGLRGNRLGYPGPDFQCDRRPGVYRIAALGDSFAVGPVVPFSDNYLTLLEKRLAGVEVYNFGVAGAGPREYVNILRRDVWTYQPDLVLASVFVGNDITEVLATPRHLDPRQHALYLFCQRGWRLFRDRGQQEKLQPGIANRCTTPALSPQVFRAVEARRLAVCFRSPSPALEKKWQRALALLDDIATDCRQHAVPLAVVLIPDEFQVNPAVLANAAVDAGVEQTAVDLQLPQRRLSAFFAERAVRCLDLLPAFGGVRDTYAPCDTHWNVRGNRLAAERLGSWLLDQPFLRR